MTAQLRTGRGVYRLTLAAPSKIDDGAHLLTLALERADGIERVVFGCRIAAELLESVPPTEAILAALAPALERDFEQVREAALKSIRTERKLHEIVFDRAHPGPFQSPSVRS